MQNKWEYDPDDILIKSSSGIRVKNTWKCEDEVLIHYYDEHIIPSNIVKIVNLDSCETLLSRINKLSNKKKISISGGKILSICLNETDAIEKVKKYTN